MATSIKDFWDRWHISFSTWLRDYIFLPLAYFLAHRMKRQEYLSISADKWIYMIAIIVTFAICGIWHGVGWTYLLWGILFGIYLTCSNWTKELQKNIRKRLSINKNSSFYSVFSIALTFVLVLFAWIFFRAGSITEAINIVRKILTTSGSVFYKPSELGFAIIGITALITIDFKHEFFGDRFLVLHSRNSILRFAGLVSIVIMILLLGVLDGGQFLYFQF